MFKSKPVLLWDVWISHMQLAPLELKPFIRDGPYIMLENTFPPHSEIKSIYGRENSLGRLFIFYWQKLQN